MKPDWKDAPEWANYLSQDKNGEWWWFSHVPKKLTNKFELRTGNSLPAYIDGWKTTLEKRPS